MTTERQRSDREDAGRPTAETWAIPRRVWFILLSWGLAILSVFALFAFWIWNNQRQQDRAMCAVMQILTSGPEPVAGPAGDRGRAILRGMDDYEKVVGCDHLLPKLPTSPR